MKYEESIANINKVGKQSIEIRFHPLISRFISEVIQHEEQDHSILGDTSDWDETPLQMLADAIMMIDGQCCECDYIITTDENEEHDFEAFVELMMDHAIWYTSEPDARENLQKVWNILKPFTIKKPITWGVK